MQASLKLRQKHLLLVSLLGHFIFLAFISSHFAFQQKLVVPGKMTAERFDTYLYHDQIARQQCSSVHPVLAKKTLENIIKKKVLALNLKHQAKQSLIKLVAKREQQKQVSSRGKPLPVLVALLHEAIQREQHYPASALEMEREGRVMLKFTLLPNGEIRQLSILKSSGTASLDDAALAAIHAALPFKGIDKYLRSAEEYQIDVVFELT